MSTCAACLRRSAVIGFLAAPIAGMLDGRRRAKNVLALPDEDLIAAMPDDWSGRATAARAAFDAEAARLEIEAAGLFALCRHDPAYPPLLAELEDAPAVLYGAGSQSRLAELIAEPAVAIVGSRRASAYGLEVARELARGLSAARVTVVSGMALGIDAAAHRGALDAGGHTIAVLACGAERAYPRTNRRLYDRIVAAGAVLGELPPRTPPRRWTFPARNRIMAGLAAVTVVVEAAEPSGSLITARFAEDLDREVGAVPGRVTSRMAAGSNRLIYDGAHVIRDAADVLDLLFGAGGWRKRQPQRAQDAEPLDDDMRRVLDAVEAGRSLDSAGAVTGLSPPDLRAALGRLELLGLVHRDGLGRYERSAAARAPSPSRAGLTLSRYAGQTESTS
jgi:DNA processing protein